MFGFIRRAWPRRAAAVMVLSTAVAISGAGVGNSAPASAPRTASTVALATSVAATTSNRAEARFEDLELGPVQIVVPRKVLLRPAAEPLVMKQFNLRLSGVPVGAIWLQLGAYRVAQKARVKMTSRMSGDITTTSGEGNNVITTTITPVDHNLVGKVRTDGQRFKIARVPSRSSGFAKWHIRQLLSNVLIGDYYVTLWTLSVQK